MQKVHMLQKEKYNLLFDLIRASLWGTAAVKADWPVYSELKHHSLVSLPAGILSSLDMPSDLRQIWQTEVYQQISYNVNCIHMQNSLPLAVPYTILKGTSAAQYYPHPRYRTLGDIDIMPRHEDYDAVCSTLVGAGFIENTQAFANPVIRHRTFQKDRILVEVHAYYSIFNDAERARYLDDLIINNINSSHVLPDLVNGMVLLAHINHHMEEGLGLRQIIDWMMFVNRCLPDERWEEFRGMAQKTGLLRLALVVTRMCEIYLGLPERRWCAGADASLCDSLMDYILDCGNFGSKREYYDFQSEKLLSYMRTPKTAFVLLQKYGRFNWKATERYPFLRPFAWLYQLIKYIKITVTRRASSDQLKSEVRIARTRNRLFDSLEVTQVSKGLAVYKDGKYIKE